MPNDIPQLEAYTAEQFRRKTGCAKGHSQGYSCEQFGETVSLQTLMSAKKKPPQCSDVRWRMELRRRARQAELGKYYTGATRENNQ